MADSRSLSDSDPHSDPFADRPRQTHFVEPERSYNSPSPSLRPYDSTVTIAQDFSAQDDDEYEKLPLNQAGGFYPPT